ncbi:MAG TPA: PfkB family carbohydrate kinase [Gemmatimonadales bacterium]|nr:PfkB family carbohydrate kinase [Gemmatimonadales bacterium]
MTGFSRGRLEALVTGMRGRQIVVVGDAMLDRYLLGDTERISPEAPVPVVMVQERRTALGGAANVAANVAALGASCRLVGVTGDDRDGEALREAMQRSGLESRWLLSVPKRPTTTKTRVVARGQQVVRIDEEDDAPLPQAMLDQLTGLALEAIADADALLLEDYDKGVMAPSLIQAVMDAAKRRKIPTVVDPKFRSFFQYHGATLFKPNRRELGTALPGIDLGSAHDLIAAADRLEVEHLLLTLGAGGMVLVTRGGKPAPLVVESIAREVYDVSGAGDTVTAWAGAVLAAGGTAAEAAGIANLAASVEVAKAGVATVSPAEVIEAYQLLE